MQNNIPQEKLQKVYKDLEDLEVKKRKIIEIKPPPQGRGDLKDSTYFELLNKEIRKLMGIKEI